MFVKLSNSAYYDNDGKVMTTEISTRSGGKRLNAMYINTESINSIEESTREVLRGECDIVKVVITITTCNKDFTVTMVGLESFLQERVNELIEKLTN
ncbi:MAG: hypothetical protein IKO41_21605 [Lachnospiraceae bacterium]|nr:hypothetical protein [Lachnospiraceae bacterium]